eukprot:11690952-Heterocapsa_arctica.AAC.1
MDVRSMADEEGECHAIRLDDDALPLTNVLPKRSDEPADGFGEPLGSAQARRRFVRRFFHDDQPLTV